MHMYLLKISMLKLGQDTIVKKEKPQRAVSRAVNEY